MSLPRTAQLFDHFEKGNMATFEEKIEKACEGGEIPGVVLLACDVTGKLFSFGDSRRNRVQDKMLI